MPELFTLTFDQKRIDALREWVMSLDSCAHNVDIWSNGVRVMGNVFADNFDSEGVRLGRKWQGLSGMTRKKRKKRGFPEAHPIMHQSGKLREMAAGKFQNWRSLSVAMSDTGQGYTNDGPTSMSASATESRFSASISGPKVTNQIGGQEGKESSKKYGAGYLAARPFWDLNESIVGLMASAMTDRIMLDWQSNDMRHTKRTGYFRLAEFDAGTKRG